MGISLLVLLSSSGSQIGIAKTSSISVGRVWRAYEKRHETLTVFALMGYRTFPITVGVSQSKPKHDSIPSPFFTTIFVVRIGLLLLSGVGVWEGHIINAWMANLRQRERERERERERQRKD